MITDIKIEGKVVSYVTDGRTVSVPFYSEDGALRYYRSLRATAKKAEIRRKFKAKRKDEVEVAPHDFRPLLLSEKIKRGLVPDPQKPEKPSKPTTGGGNTTTPPSTTNPGTGSENGPNTASDKVGKGNK